MTKTLETLQTDLMKAATPSKNEEEQRKRAYRGVYRYTNRIGNGRGDPLQLVFWFAGELRDAKLRFRKHCDIMGYKYINCSVFIVDLEARETLRAESKDWDDNENENY